MIGLPAQVGPFLEAFLQVLAGMVETMRLCVAGEYSCKEFL
jgi:hypothetical protein